MGFWGSYVLAKGPDSIVNWPALAEFEDEFDDEDEDRYGPWTLGTFEGGDLEMQIEPVLRALEEQSGTATLSGFVLDSDAVKIDAYSKRNGHWRACLVRNSMKIHAEEIDEDFDSYLTPGAAVAAASSWAIDAGLTPDRSALEAVFVVDAVEDWFGAVDLFLDLLTALGLVPDGA